MTEWRVGSGLPLTPIIIAPVQGTGMTGNLRPDRTGAPLYAGTFLNPKHGNWGHELPVVHRWAYDYSVPGYPDDFIPQNVPAEAAPGAENGPPSENETSGPDEGGTTT